MNKKLLIGIMVVIAGLMIAMAILKNFGWATLLLTFMAFKSIEEGRHLRTANRQPHLMKGGGSIGLM